MFLTSPSFCFTLVTVFPSSLVTVCFLSDSSSNRDPMVRTNGTRASYIMYSASRKSRRNITFQQIHTKHVQIGSQRPPMMVQTNTNIQNLEVMLHIRHATRIIYSMEQQPGNEARGL
eukprot:576979_1